MSPEFVITFGREAFIISIMLAGPALLVGLAVGLLVSIFQAITQIQELTLTFIPKIVAIALTLALLFPWLLSQSSDYFVRVLSNIPNYIGQ